MHEIFTLRDPRNKEIRYVGVRPYGRGPRDNDYYDLGRGGCGIIGGFFQGLRDAGLKAEFEVVITVSDKLENSEELARSIAGHVCGELLLQGVRLVNNPAC